MKEMSDEQIQGTIDYYKGKLEKINESIRFYRDNGAMNNIDWELEQALLFENKIASFKNVLKNGPEKKEGIKVRVTEYKGCIVVETIDEELFDLDFTPNGGGQIGCTLNDVNRLAMSQEAVDAIRKLKRVGDSIGDFMNGSNDYFCWIGGTMSVKTPGSVVSRDFKMPVGYHVIPNETSEKGIQEVDNIQNQEKERDYKNLKHEIWIELRESTTRIDPGEGLPFEHVSDGYHTLEVSVKRKYYSENDYKVINAPEGTVRDCKMFAGDDSGREYQLTQEEYEKITDLAKACFEGMKGKIKHSYWGWETTGFKIPKDDVMSFANGFFKVGFENNIANPRMDYWRLSMKATTEDIKKALKSFKRL